MPLITSIQYKDNLSKVVQVTFDDGTIWNQELSRITPYSTMINNWIADPANTVLPRKTALEIKQSANVALTEQRDVLFDTMKVTYAGYLIAAGPKERQEINGACTNIIISRLAGVPDTTIKWTTDDNQDITFTMDQMLEIGVAVAATYTAIHEQIRAAKLAL